MIKYYLTENHFTKESEDYVAHVIDAKVHDMESVVDRMLSLGAAGTKGDILKVLSNFSEALAQITKDGERVNLPFLKTSFSITGVFTGASDGFDGSRHEVHINTPTAREIKALTEFIKVHKVDSSVIAPHIVEVVDSTTGSINDAITPSAVIAVEGKHLKVEGNDPSIGIFFENTQDKSKHKVGVIASNSPTHLVVMVPALAAGTYQLKIVTQYRNNGSVFSKTTREGVFDKVLTVR